MHIAYNKVLVESKMLFTSPITSNFSVELPYDARSINNDVDDFEFPAILDSNRLMFYLNDNKVVSYYYITTDLLEGNSLLASIDVPFDTKDLRVRVSLPESAILDKPVKRGALSGSSIYPRPTMLETDGQVITAVWEFNDVKKGEELDFLVNYRKPFRYWIPILLIILSAMAIFIAVTYFVVRPKKQYEKEDIKRSDNSPDSSIDKHVKDDEQQIINILRLKEGSCNQGTLRVATGFSKAKLSGLLKEMETRKMVHKEKRGKKNLVSLKE